MRLTSLLTKQGLHIGATLAAVAGTCLLLKAWISSAPPQHPRSTEPIENTPFATLLIRGAAGLAALAGGWLILSPWVLPGLYPTTSTWDNLAVGTVVLAIMGLKAVAPDIRWISLAGILIGLWVMFSPWILHHADHEIALQNEVITATAIILASSAAMMTTIYLFGPPRILQEEAPSSNA